MACHYDPNYIWNNVGLNFCGVSRMSKTAFSLCDKGFTILQLPSLGKVYTEDDVKEFIRLLIKKFEGMEIVSGEVIKFEVRQLAGEKLT